MSIRSWRLAPTTNLARARLVLAASPVHRRWVWSTLVVVACAAGAAGSHLYWVQRFDRLQEQAVALKDVQALQRQLEQSRLQLRVSDARSEELEHQIDALNQQLRASQEELTFFRKARDGRH